jgi:hypothetical protein
MLRGSRPGERRGGRKRGTPNKRTVLANRLLSVGSGQPTASWSALLASLVKDQELPADIRMAVAVKCFPPKRPQSSRSDRPRILAGIQATMQQEVLAEVGSAEAPERSDVRGSDTASSKLSPQTIDAFVGIVQEVTADPKARRKAALQIAESVLPKARKKPKILPDEFGFSVNPNLARRYRDIVRKQRFLARQPNCKVPAVAEKIKKLEVRAGRILAGLELPCPTRYGFDQAAKDSDRLIELIYARAEAGLTEEQDAEEAHLRVRADLYWNGPEETARRQRTKVEESRKRLEEWNGGPELNFSPSDSKLVVKHNIAVQPTLEEMGVPADFKEFMDD